MNGWLKRVTVLALIALSCLWAAGEAIEGTVKDNTGGVIPGVTVVLTSVDTGTTRQALSDDGGFFVFSNIKPGNYEIRAELEGFQQAIRDSEVGYCIRQEEAQWEAAKNEFRGFEIVR